MCGGEIGGKETVSTNKGDGVYKDGARDGATRAENSTLDDWFGILNPEASTPLKMVNCAIELLGSDSGNFVGLVPSENGLYDFKLRYYKDVRTLGPRRSLARYELGHPMHRIRVSPPARLGRMSSALVGGCIWRRPKANR